MRVSSKVLRYTVAYQADG
jgi:hypothetical protein